MHKQTYAMPNVTFYQENVALWTVYWNNRPHGFIVKRNDDAFELTLPLFHPKAAGHMTYVLEDIGEAQKYAVEALTGA